MSWRVHSNVALRASRQLPQVFSAKAMGTTAPNSLTGGVKLSDSMGLTTHAGIVSGFTDLGAQYTVTAYYFSWLRWKADSTKGWMLAGPVAAIYTQTVDPEATFTFTIPEGSSIFIQGSAAANNLWLAGTVRDNANKNADITPTTTT